MHKYAYGEGARGKRGGGARQALNQKNFRVPNHPYQSVSVYLGSGFGLPDPLPPRARALSEKKSPKILYLHLQFIAHDVVFCEVSIRYEATT